MKQETLEEAAERFRSENPGTMQGGNNTKILNAFNNGAKWQQERMYSEEEIENAFNAGFNYANDKSGNIPNFEDFIKQYKK